ncbi:photoreceptor-specific nuclear receptor-like isoform X2 [Rhopilema esculentum]|uniref:photoreceptor-specific nuclear receptor-like isoform X2 n=1 Tax=Rhopilema esculentum TaxID=499914 RepID=UPI0031DDD7D5
MLFLNLAVQHERAPRNAKQRIDEDVSSPSKIPEDSKGQCGTHRSPSSPNSHLYHFQFPSRKINDPCSADCRQSSVPLTPPLTPKNPPHVPKSPDALYELSVRVLHSTITWARNIPTFLELPFKDQALLLEESWVDLFLLSLAQWDVEIDLHVMLKAAGIDKENRTTGEIMGAIADLNHLQNVVNKFKSLQLDSTEYACLKAISLFKPELRNILSISHVENLQDQAQVMLSEYSRSRSPDVPVRFGKMLLSLAALRSISPRIIEFYFFRGSLDSVPVEKLFVDYGFNRNLCSQTHTQIPHNEIKTE